MPSSSSSKPLSPARRAKSSRTHHRHDGGDDEQPPPATTTSSRFSLINKYSNLSLPDGTHRRKLEKIKSSLIHKAKLTAQVRKLKIREREGIEEGRRRFARFSAAEREQERSQEQEQNQQQIASEEARGGRKRLRVESGGGGGDDDDHDNEPAHAPKRRRSSPAPPQPTSPEDTSPLAQGDDEDEGGRRNTTHPSRLRNITGSRPRTNRFASSQALHAAKFAERESRDAEHLAREEASRQRERERARWSKAVSAKTRTGQVKLGRQSGLLLEKIKKQMGV